ncbi:Concanavalin A-like lectin/glucanases superfamily [uncultured Caudovirales phage]|uniref:Concanavalin A-like lectin/glucanases superfamily n=1 Tax=uncultured Caudovirales phage TaxID=2100421 RepID=A0A6J7WMS5_9CAUD|nr:Concanavalin A-like lectin/glucanases superfamily [uncultured Caudovirales phage]
MAYPSLTVSIAFTDGPYVESPTWTPVSSYVRTASIRRGKSSDNDTFGTGTASVTLDNIARRFDPFNTAGPYYGNLIPRRQIKIEATAGATTYPVFRGFVSGWPVEYTDAGYDSTVTLDCYDLFGLLTDQLLPQDWSYKTITDAIYIGAYYRFNDPENTTTVTPALTADGYGNSYGGLMTQTAGTVPLTKYDSLAAGLSSQSTHIGRGNSYRSTPGAWVATAGNIGNMSTAFWWAPDTPSSLSYPVVANGKNGKLEFAVLASGALRVRFYGSATYYEATSTTTPLNGFAPHHLAGSWNGTTVRVYIDGQNVSGSTTSAALSSTITPYTVEVSTDILQELVVSTENGSAVWSDATVLGIYQAGTGSIPETTAARFSRYLATTSIPSGLYSATSAPEGTVADIDADTAITNGLQRLAASESGDIYVSKQGVLTQTYRSYAAAQAAGSTAAALTDNGGAGLTYGTALSIYADSDNSQNDITISFSSGGQIRGSNSTAISATGTKSGSYETDLSTNDQAKALLDYRLNIDATIVPQISPLEVSTNTSDAAWVTILGLELLSKLTLTRTPPTGSAFTTTLLVQSIEHEIKAKEWSTRLTGTARYNGWFVLDTSALDGPDLLLG